ncbi:metal ABC transporter solute-binding protein, Zn/Mn family [Enterococcus timonensis]|uniref:metal ABC transporter solute-binding protein, Zn/Mn family n=1 Tax=Enterococcus timonensis TaxID=1852364 RepID=UPI0008DA8D1E|nr:zinc ABC transporter substrate-binding protein [Enterococcus timonensis]
MKKKFFAGLLLLLMLTLSGCNAAEAEQNGDGTPVDDDKPTIVATFYPMYAFVKMVVGDTANVELLIPAGTEPHDYEPSAKDMAKIADADAFVYNSVEMETWVTDVLKNIGDTPAIEAAKEIDLVETDDEDDHSHDAHDHSHDEETETAADEEAVEGETETGHNHSHTKDPHVWLDPVYAAIELSTIMQELTTAIPGHADIWLQNAVDAQYEFDALNEEFEAALGSATQRTFVTQHAAFYYLAARYNLEQVAIAGLSAEVEPSPKRLAELKDFVDDKQISVIYFEQNASQKISETLANEAGVELAVLDPLESLSPEKIQNGADYFSVMRENLASLTLSIK